MSSHQPKGTPSQQHFQPASAVNGEVLRNLVEAGLTWLRTNQQIVNSLNVFPVPDGDTGTNMVLTMQAAFDEVANGNENNFGKVCHAIAHGSLMGARGNSGVILSQIWRGFARAVDNLETLDAPTLIKALASARDTAYKGVVRPVEGTILTVIKDVASAAQNALNETHDLLEILERIVAAADNSVQRTPELLPILREAGVVDSGGKGLFFILEGMLRYAKGLPLDSPTTTVLPIASMNLQRTIEHIEPGQDVEVVIDFRPHGKLDIEAFYHDLEKMGTSIQLGEGDGIYRLHIHVAEGRQYEPIEYIKRVGTFTKVAMENLAAQMEHTSERSNIAQLTLAPVEPGQIAAVAVAPGPGIARVFASLGVAAIVHGGQTMNPSTQEILSAFENLPTDKIVILPNNKNIIRTAEAAKELTVKKVAVIPTRSVPQGLAAMMRLSPHADFDQVVDEMEEAIHQVETGEITRATRSVEVDGVAVKEGEFIALHNGRLVASSPSLTQVTLKLLQVAHADHFELITLFYGKDLTKQEANQIADEIRFAYPEQEIEVQDGGQPHYYFIISIE
ncbi:MAG: DAK2 domain-containing protein [Anaerolineales bacterium]|nr:DAK2 domain-containing protein [Anaerolineales bacterium]MCS7246895.1 DAK2 domain-containing protein [Anaerolineales bacterium]MDW8160706.1 DAK2 domain-containing protein [Anaerolineales bacterium]MDW8445978.1 DAK2 domain-containing protein [Anaerolineales bacterium]